MEFFCLTQSIALISKLSIFSPRPKSWKHAAPSHRVTIQLVLLKIVVTWVKSHWDQDKTWRNTWDKWRWLTIIYRYMLYEFFFLSDILVIGYQLSIFIFVVNSLSIDWLNFNSDILYESPEYCTLTQIL